jgi:hypothetical protein
MFSQAAGLVWPGGSSCQNPIETASTSFERRRRPRSEFHVFSTDIIRLIRIGSRICHPVQDRLHQLPHEIGIVFEVVSLVISPLGQLT